MTPNHLAVADPGDTCWVASTGPAAVSRGCAADLRAFWSVGEEARDVQNAAAFVPFAASLLVGVALGASLAGERRGRSSWGLAAIGVLGLALAGLVAAGELVRVMAHAAQPWSWMGPGRIPTMTVMGTEGAPFVGRGVMASGIGLLAGAVLMDQGARWRRRSRSRCRWSSSALPSCTGSRPGPLPSGAR